MVTFNLHHDREDWPSRRRTILAELKRLQRMRLPCRR